MNKRLELYEIAIANAESDSDLNYIIEHASFDELLTDDEYTELYLRLESLVRHRGAAK